MTNPISNTLERLFKLSENNTTVRTELAAGLTTFLTMAYIIFVNPQILSEAGVPFSGALFATCLSAAVGSLMMGVIFIFLFVDLFDTIGSLMGLGRQAGYLTPEGKMPRVNRALFADAIATIAGSIFGTSTVVTYIESATGVSEGGRTGLTAVTVAALFVLAMFFAPVAGAIPPIATAPALIIVGALMIGAVTSIKWEDLTEAVLAFLTMLAMPLTFSIANGLALGFIFYPLLKVLTGRWREASPLVYILAGLFVLRYVYLGAE